MSLDSPARVCPSPHNGSKSIFPRRSITMAVDDSHLYVLKVFLFSFNPDQAEHRLNIDFHKRSTAEELVEKVLELRENNEEFINCSNEDFELYDTMGTLDGRTYKERKMDSTEYPVIVQTMWPRGSADADANTDPSVPRNRLVLKSKKRRSVDQSMVVMATASAIDTFLAKFLAQPQDREYADLCVLPELTEQTLLENMRDRFNNGKIYTYIGPILVAVNPFSFFPIYNPKYSRLYCQSRRLGTLPPHVFAIADITYHNLIRQKENQVVVISGESGSGKTESANFLLHHLTTLSQKGNQAAIEQQILAAGPVLEAFGNAVTLQNNNSSRFGKFIKVNYRENGIVCGANVEIYLLEKSRIISQAVGESCFTCDQCNEKHEFERLKHAMGAVGFSENSQQKIYGMISAVLLLGNIEYIKRKSFHSDENAFIENEEMVGIISALLSIRAAQLSQALTMRRTVLKHDVLITRYSVAEATQTRDAMAKCLYNALFHWIVLRINHSLIRRESAAVSKNGLYIGILDIFGFEDVGAQWNSFEQLCINYANERLQAYFNQHIFQFEQEEYMKENIHWTPIQYTDNTECVQMFQNKPYGLLRLVDEESNINNGMVSDQSMLDKLNHFLRTNEYYEVPHKREAAFIIAHYAGKVKYQIVGFREKNKDLMRHDVMNVLKGSKSAFVRELVGEDPLAVFRWALVRATFRATFAFRAAGKRNKRAGSVDRFGTPKGDCRIIGNNVSDVACNADASLKMHRRSSDSHLNAFLRGELSPSIVPDFCDISVFKTIVERARKTPKKPHNERLSNLRSLQQLKGIMCKKHLSNKPSSVSRQFGESLSRLMKTLDRASPYFIRCIKSNNEKIPNYFDDNIILRQLRYTGMLETVRIRRAGYSVRIEYGSFANQYRTLLPNGPNSTKEDIQEFIRSIPAIEYTNLQYGNTKIFMRDTEKLLLDDHLHRVIMKNIVTLQRWFRAKLEQRHYQKFRQGIVKLQAMARGVLARTRLKRRDQAAICIQCWWRMVMVRCKYQLIRQTIIALQALVRRHAQRKCVIELRASKENGSVRRPIIVDRLQRLTKVTLPKFDLNDPDSLAAFASPESLDYSQELDEEDDLLDDEWREPVDEEEEEMDDDEEDIFDECPPIGGMLSSEKRDSSELDLDASFVLENARLKLIKSHDQKQFEKLMHRRQSLAATASTKKLKMLRRAASTESDQIQLEEDTNTVSKITSSLSKVAPRACKSGFMKAKKQLKALLTKAGRQGTCEGTFSEESLNMEGPSSSTRSSSKEAEKLLLKHHQCHNFKPSRLHKGDKCDLCNRPLSGLLVQGFKCYGCKLLFHKECATFAVKIPCTSPITSPPPQREAAFRRPWDIMVGKTPRNSLAGVSPCRVSFLPITSFNLTKTKQMTDPTALLIESIDDLREFSVFIFKKQTYIGQQNKRETLVDAIFKRSLREFHMELCAYTTIVYPEGNTVLKYHDLIGTFEGLLSKMCHEEQVTFPTVLGVNAFRGFLNEFMHQRKRRGSSKRTAALIKTVRKKRRRSDITLHNGHHFNLDYVHIPTYCEICNMFMWHAERIFICISCRLSCHKKCHTKVNYVCAKATSGEVSNSSKFFGADLSNLLMDDDQTVPVLLDRLLANIEVKALFVEGIYRKSGQLALIKQTRKQIELAEDPESIPYDDIPIHVLTSLVKAFFRELSEPLITADLYENFVNISEIKETNERVRCLRAMMQMLPKGNKCVLDRLVYHLARVAHQESVNKMSASNLAVIFAPCIVRRNTTTMHAQEQLMDVQKQAICVQTLIEDKLRHCQETLSQIVELETASEKVTENLRRIEKHRLSAGATSECAVPGMPNTATELNMPTSDNLQRANSEQNMETARQLFEEQLDFLDKEKAKLLQELPPLAPVASSEDLTDDAERESGAAEATPGGEQRQRTKASSRQRSVGESHEEYALDLNVPPVISCLPHVCKSRAKRQAGARAPSAMFFRQKLDRFLKLY
ncbi:hypothetical protein GPALN_014914 [Globodera pallida]|nr:hypothetical protein GPALN_014914 [Globodera pallida]